MKVLVIGLTINSKGKRSIAFEILISEYDFLKRYADDLGLSLSALVRYLVQYSIYNHMLIQHFNSVMKNASDGN